MNDATNHEKTSYGEYGVYSAQQSDYRSPDEMPQSSYPHSNYVSAEVPPYSTDQQQQQYYQPPFTTPADVSSYERTSMGLKARTAAMLSYLVGWIGGLVILLLERDNRFVRFHAMQSLLFFGSLTILERVLSFMPFGIDGFLRAGIGIAMVVGWFVMLNATRQGKYYKLPLFGDYAERYVDKIKIR